MDHLNGPLTMGHIAAGCALGYVDFRLGDRDWRTGRKPLADWFAGFGARDSMARTVPSA